MFLLVSLSLMTLTEVLENYFLLPLMQEAWCRSWRQCVQTLPLHTRPSPPSGGAFRALLCRKEFLLNCSSHSPQIIEWPEAQILWPSCALPLLCMGMTARAAGQDVVPESKDYCRHLTWWFSWFLISWKMLLLLVCSFVCFIFWKFFIQSSFHLLGKEKID